MTDRDAETDPGRQTPARKRLVSRRWFVAAVVLAGVRIPLDMIGFDDFSFPLLLWSAVCLGFGCHDAGWVRGFEAGRREGASDMSQHM